MSETLLISGAGGNQIGIFIKARAMGIKTVAADGNPQAPAFPHADAQEVIDILDPHALIQAARKHKADAIYPAAELSVEAVAEASAHLGLPGLAPEAARRARNKFEMRQALERAGVPSADYRLARNAVEAREAAAALGFPLIVKPVDANSSKGVLRVDSLDEIDAAFNNAFPYSLSDGVLLESFLEGTEFGVDGLMYEGQYTHGGTTGKVLSPLPHRFDLALFMPPRGLGHDDGAIVRCVEQALQAIGVTTATTHVEVMLTAEGPHIVEIAARPGGARIPTDLVPLAYGMDFIADSIRISLGHAPCEKRMYERGSAIYWMPAEPGVVEKITGGDEAAQVKGVREIDFSVAVGEGLDPIVDCVTRDKVGYALTEGESAKDALRIAREALDLCAVHTR
jgi:biotin carboxylase